MELIPRSEIASL